MLPAALPISTCWGVVYLLPFLVIFFVVRVCIPVVSESDACRASLTFWLPLFPPPQLMLWHLLQEHLLHTVVAAVVRSTSVVHKTIFSLKWMTRSTAEGPEQQQRKKCNPRYCMCRPRTSPFFLFHRAAFLVGLLSIDRFSYETVLHCEEVLFFFLFSF